MPLVADLCRFVRWSVVVFAENRVAFLIAQLPSCPIAPVRCPLPAVSFSRFGCLLSATGEPQPSPVLSTLPDVPHGL